VMNSDGSKLERTVRRQRAWPADVGVVSHVEDTRWGRELIGGKENRFGGGEEAEAEPPEAVVAAADPVETRSAPPPPLAPPAGSPGLPRVPLGIQYTG
jgi:hypothetical protein